MTDMNYIGAIVKILETPKQKFINSNILVIKFRAQLPQVRKSRIIKLVIWGKLARAVLDYYKINDYILIEGYASLREKNNSLNINKKPLKKVTITVLKVYPFLLNYNRFINKLS
jgi:single-stranded DNA-binding protein